MYIYYSNFAIHHFSWFNDLFNIRNESRFKDSYAQGEESIWNFRAKRNTQARDSKKQVYAWYELYRWFGCAR